MFRGDVGAGGTPGKERCDFADEDRWVPGMTVLNNKDGSAAVTSRLGS